MPKSISFTTSVFRRPLPIREEKDILGLQVAMDDAAFVNDGESIEHLGESAAHPLEMQTPGGRFVQGRLQRLSVEELQNEIDDPRVVLDAKSWMMAMFGCALRFRALTSSAKR